MTLQAISEKYSGIELSGSNYSIGGGLDSCKFASRRHEDAKNDSSRLTLGQANQVFAKATGLPVDQIREVIEYAVPYPEWHHAGKLPKSYGGGMKKTYFINSEQMAYIAANFDTLLKEVEEKKAEAKVQREKEMSLKERQDAFLKENATYVSRVSNRPENFYMTEREMNGKYGWFDSTYKRYNLPEYFSGWQFESAEKMNQFFNL